MNVTQEEVVDRQTVLLIELDDEDLDGYLDRSYKRAVQRVAIPGFRKGKAPRVMVERFLGREYLINDSLDIMIPEVTRSAIESQELDTVGLPKVDLVSLEPFSVKATVALTPQVELGAYRDLRLDQKPVEVTDEDVESKLQEHVEAASTWEPVDRSVKMQDMLTMDVRGIVEERTIVEESDTVYVPRADSEWPFIGFAPNLEGAEVNAHKQFTATIPDDYGDSSLAGKEASFEVNISEIKERVAPELDDEFAKSVDGDHDTLAELRDHIRNDLIEEAGRVSDAEYRDAVLDELAKTADVELPPLLIEHEVEHMVERRDNFVKSLEMTLDDYLRYTGKTDEEVRQEMNEEAQERFARSYALSTFAELEGIEVTDEEIDERIQAMKEAQSEDARATKPQDMDSDEVRESVQENLVLRNALDRLIIIAKGEGEGPDTGSSELEQENQLPSEEGTTEPKDGGDDADNSS